MDVREFSSSHRGARCLTAGLHHLSRCNGRVEGGLQRFVTASRHHFHVLERVGKGAHADVLSGIGPRLRLDEAHQPLDSRVQLLDTLILFPPIAV